MPTPFLSGSSLSENSVAIARLAMAAAFVIGAELFTTTATAETFPIPSDSRVGTVEIPDSWRPAATANGIEGAALEGSVHLMVGFVSASDVDGATVMAVKRLAERGVVVAPQTKRTSLRHFAGFESVKIDFSATASQEESDVSLTLVAASRRPGFIAICYWGDDDAMESVSNDMLSIADSLQIMK